MRIKKGIGGRTDRKTKDGRTLYAGEYERLRGGYEFKYRETTGKQRTISAATLEELRQKEQEYQKDKAAGVSSTAITVRQLFEDYMDTRVGSNAIRTSTAANYRNIFRGYIEPELGSCDIKDITNSRIKRFYNGLMARGMAKDTVRACHMVLVAIFGQALTDHQLAFNPARDAFGDTAKAASKAKAEAGDEGAGGPKHALTLAEQSVFLDVLAGYEGPRRDCLILILETGLRIGEAAALTWDDVDFTAGRLYVRRTLAEFYSDGKKVREIHPPKSLNGFRSIPLSPRALEALGRQKARPACTDTISGVTGFIFSTKDGRAIGQKAANKWIMRAVEKAGGALPAFTCHCLRRTFATNAVRRGISLPVLLDLMGHSSLSVTLSYYIEVQDDMKAGRDADSISEQALKNIAEAAAAANNAANSWT